MRRIDATADERFHPGNPQIRQPGTIVPAWWLNAIQEEIAQAIEKSGIPLDETKTDQLYSAMVRIAGAAFGAATITKAGIVRLATDAEAQERAHKTAALTPYGLGLNVLQDPNAVTEGLILKNGSHGVGRFVRAWDVGAAAASRRWYKLGRFSGSPGNRATLIISGGANGATAGNNNCAALGFMSLTIGNTATQDGLLVQYWSTSIGLGDTTGNSSISDIVSERHGQGDHTLWVQVAPYAQISVLYQGTISTVTPFTGVFQDNAPEGISKRSGIHLLWSTNSFDPTSKADKSALGTASGKDVIAWSDDTTPGRILDVGAYGLGTYSRTWKVCSLGNATAWVKLATVTGEANGRGTIQISGAATGYGATQNTSAAVGVLSLVMGNAAAENNLAVQYMHTARPGSGGSGGFTAIRKIVTERHSNTSFTIWLEVGSFTKVIARYDGDFKKIDSYYQETQEAIPPGFDKSDQIFVLWNSQNFDPATKADTGHTHAIDTIAGLPDALAKKQNALGYWPISRAGDNGITGTLVTSVNLEARNRLVAGSAWADWADSIMIDNNSMWLGNAHSKFRMGREDSYLSLWRYTGTSAYQGRVFAVGGDHIMRFDKRPIAEGRNVALSGDLSNWVGDVVQIDTPAHGYVYDLPWGYVMMGVSVQSQGGDSRVYAIRGMRISL